MLPVSPHRAKQAHPCMRSAKKSVIPRSFKCCSRVSPSRCSQRLPRQRTSVLMACESEQTGTGSGTLTCLCNLRSTFGVRALGPRESRVLPSSSRQNFCNWTAAYGTDRGLDYAVIGTVSPVGIHDSPYANVGFHPISLADL